MIFVIIGIVLFILIFVSIYLFDKQRILSMKVKRNSKRLDKADEEIDELRRYIKGFDIR